jgi:Acyclic terpene utilisation family protein AtuA
MRSRPGLGYESHFLQQLAWNEGAGARLLAEKIKVVQNDGAPNPRGLATEIHRYLLKQGLDNPKVALSVSFVGEEVYEGGRRKNLQPSLYQKAVTGQTLQSSVATTTLQSKTLHLLGRPISRPLDNLVFARSGDKGGNAGIGFWVRESQASSWLQSF